MIEQLSTSNVAYQQLKVSPISGAWVRLFERQKRIPVHVMHHAVRRIFWLTSKQYDQMMQSQIAGMGRLRFAFYKHWPKSLVMWEKVSGKKLRIDWNDEFLIDAPIMIVEKNQSEHWQMQEMQLVRGVFDLQLNKIHDPRRQLMVSDHLLTTGWLSDFCQTMHGEDAEQALTSALSFLLLLSIEAPLKVSVSYPVIKGIEYIRVQSHYALSGEKQKQVSINQLKAWWSCVKEAQNQNLWPHDFIFHQALAFEQEILGTNDLSQWAPNKWEYFFSQILDFYTQPLGVEIGNFWIVQDIQEDRLVLRLQHPHEVINDYRQHVGVEGYGLKLSNQSVVFYQYPARGLMKVVDNKCVNQIIGAREANMQCYQLKQQTKKMQSIKGDSYEQFL